MSDWRVNVFRPVAGGMEHQQPLVDDIAGGGGPPEEHPTEWERELLARTYLLMIRSAIQEFARDNAGAFPGDNGDPDTFKEDLYPYILRAFPACPVGANQDDEVEMTASASFPLPDDPFASKGWRYSFTTGIFIINSSDQSVFEPELSLNLI